MSANFDGLLVIDKPAGVTSHDVVATVRKKFGIKKVGHAGTLDPAATGVLILGVGQATRLLPFLVGHDKTYTAVIRLGVTTISDDAEGSPLEVTDTSTISEVEIERAMSEMTGTSLQQPPAVSARHTNGERAYQVVLRGETPKLESREVGIHKFDFESMSRGVTEQPDGSQVEHIDVQALCEVTSGTYIRAMARDLGARLGVGGHVVSLRRVKSGPWLEAQAIDIDQVDRAAVLPMCDVVTQLFPTRILSEVEVSDISHGRPIKDTQENPAEVVALLTPQGELLAMAKIAAKQVRPTTVFMVGVVAHA